MGGVAWEMDCADSGIEAQEYAQPSHLSTNPGRWMTKEFEELAGNTFDIVEKQAIRWWFRMDGKMLRGTIDTEVSDGLCLLAVYLPGEGVTLAQVAIESKQNEITAAPTLLGYVDLRNKVVIGDALHTQRQISIQIGKAGGNYLWTVKGNQPQLLQDLQDWFDPKVDLLPGMGCPPKDFRSATLTSKGHGTDRSPHLDHQQPTQ